MQVELNGSKAGIRLHHMSICDSLHLCGLALFTSREQATVLLAQIPTVSPSRTSSTVPAAAV